MVWRRMLFGEFQDGFKVDVDLIHLKGMIQAILGLHFALKTPINFRLKRTYRLEDVV